MTASRTRLPAAARGDPTQAEKAVASGILFFARDGFRMDTRRGVAQRSTGAPCAHGEDLREHRERGLRRRLGADVEPARSGDPVEVGRGDSRAEGQLAPALLLAPPTERPE